MEDHRLPDAGAVIGTNCGVKAVERGVPDTLDRLEGRSPDRPDLGAVERGRPRPLNVWATAAG